MRITQPNGAVIICPDNMFAANKAVTEIVDAPIIEKPITEEKPAEVKTPARGRPPKRRR